MPSLTNYGQQVCLYDDTRAVLGGLTGSASGAGGIANVTARLELFDSSSTLSKNMTTLTLNTPGGGGYTAFTGLTKGSDWGSPSVPSTDAQVVLNNKTFTASGNPINNIDGAWIADSDSNALAYWERSSPISLVAGDSITADTLTIRIV